MIYIILGFHKSGTTLVSQTLHHAGVVMGDFDAEKGYDQKNFYEQKDVKRLNDEILGAEGVLSINIRAPKRLHITPDQRCRMQDIIQAFSAKHTHWGFKDPRTCLTYPLWAEVLPPHHIIAVYRDPAEMWKRYRPKRRRDHLLTFYRAYKYLSRWCEHNLGTLNALQNPTQSHIVINYRRLMTTDDEFHRLKTFVGFPLPDRRDKSLYRSQPTSAPVLSIASRLLQIRHGYTPESIMQALDRKER